MSASINSQIIASYRPSTRPRAAISMIAIDVLTLELALVLGCLTRLVAYPFFPIGLGPAQYAGPAAGILLLPMAYYWAGLYPGYGLGRVHRLRARVWATAMMFGTLLLWNYMFAGQHWSRGVLLSTMVFATVLPPLVQSLFQTILRPRGLCGVPAIILGAGTIGGIITEKLKTDIDLDLVPIAVLDDDPKKWGTLLHGVPIVGPLSASFEFQGQAQVALVAMPELDRAGLVQLVQRLAFPRVIVVPNLSGLQTLWTSSRDLGGILGLEVRNNLLVTRNRVFKRALDCTVALPLLLCMAPVIALCAALIKIISPGPAFYCQEREGADGERIKVWKLRTMRLGAERLLEEYLESTPAEKESWLRHFKLKNDPRILPFIGASLRRFSMDELPQLWNILTGQMSLVGPRPFPLYHLQNFSREFRELRRSVTPGLTGLWQVSERSDGDLNTQERQDTYYIRNWSLWLDIYILLRTMKTVLLAKGAY